MIFNSTFIDGLFVIDLDLSNDERGWFTRTFCKEEFKKTGNDIDWVQINHSFNNYKGTLRGMHYQHPPYAEIKLVRCICGAIYDVVIDLRKNSSTFLQWYGIELSAQNKKRLYIPKGFAHGFLTLANGCKIIYHHTNYYNPEAEGGIKYNDPLININWPSSVKEISDRDKRHQYLSENFNGI